VFLPISMLLFSLVVLQLAATIKKSVEEGHSAFLSPLLRSSRQQVLHERLEELLNKHDTKGILTLLVDSGIMKETGRGLGNLENLEVSIAKDLESNYNRILHYLPDDLKEFFEAYKMLWDVENLKLLMCYALRGKGSEECVSLTGPLGYLDLRSIELLSKSRLPEGVLENALNFLPTEFSLKISPEKRWTANELEFSLDAAAFEYLREKGEEIGTQKVRLLWDFLTGAYEVENIVNMARLKYFKVPSEDVNKFLFSSRKLLSHTDLKRLLDAEDYSAFLLALHETPYGKYVPTRMVDPMGFEVSLKKELQRSELEETRLDVSMERVIRFLVELEERYDMMRKAAYFAVIKRSDEV